MVIPAGRSGSDRAADGSELKGTVTTFIAPDTVLPSTAHTALVRRVRRASMRSPFSEVREQPRQRTLMMTATGIVSALVAASAAIVLGLSA